LLAKSGPKTSVTNGATSVDPAPVMVLPATALLVLKPSVPATSAAGSASMGMKRLIRNLPPGWIPVRKSILGGLLRAVTEQ